MTTCWPDGDAAYHVTIDNGTVRIASGEANDATVTFTQDGATATAVSRGELSAQGAFMTGLIRIRGDLPKLIEHADVFVLEDHAVVLRRPANFSWYTGGADAKVDHVAPEGVADLVVRGDSQLVLTNTIEAPRMRAEQVPALEVLEYPWYKDRLAARVKAWDDGAWVREAALAYGARQEPRQLAA